MKSFNAYFDTSLDEVSDMTKRRVVKKRSEVRDKSILNGLLGNQAEKEHADKQLKFIDRLKNAKVTKNPCCESDNSFESDKAALLHHVETAEDTPEAISNMHKQIHSLWKKHGEKSLGCYDDIAANDKAKPGFRTASTL